jgi:hypothetical protein
MASRLWSKAAATACEVNLPSSAPATPIVAAIKIKHPHQDFMASQYFVPPLELA